MNRRQALAGLTATTALATVPQIASAHAKRDAFKYALNMSTLRGHKLGFMKEIEVASKAGYRHVEIWINTLQDYLKNGGTTAEARRHLNDSGIVVEDAIGFATWIVDDNAARTKAIEQLKQEMGILAEIGCTRIAAPPMGATNEAGLDLKKAAERYNTILDLGDQSGVVPHLELWGFSKNLSRVSELLYVAVESGHPSAKVLMDVYHLHKGGSGLQQVGWVGKPFIEVFHINDYPASPPRETIVDADRVYPGDGVGPLKDLLSILKNPEKPVILSLEVFNPTYYAQDALLVAKTGLAKMKQVTQGV
ncbi:sugar phosphate isomerase/epimerase family protein [Arundinibacter roseus]|uniref:Sugar phosphate isomerase/epimerase n=1 Tax=Arundinibacter roseus TaxID=2070510 RepID=A0A4R4KM32_9BACT|nr:sugar phosphate isomerase/epimerase family protein [Arundinibacter roseus]TDB68066.1 sugar phosphate isomerase/epimerase [Arundinibacter roseus]